MTTTQPAAPPADKPGLSEVGQNIKDAVAANLRFAPKAAIEALHKMFKKEGETVDGDKFKEVLIDRHLKDLVEQHILKQDGYKKGARNVVGTRGKLTLLVPLDHIKETPRGRVTGGEAKPSTARAKPVSLNLESLGYFYKDLEKLVKSKADEVTKELQAELDESVAHFTNNVKMGVGPDALKLSMDAVVKKRKALQESSGSILTAAVKEMGKEGKYPAQLIKVMQGKL